MKTSSIVYFKRLFRNNNSQIKIAHKTRAIYENLFSFLGYCLFLDVGFKAGLEVAPILIRFFTLIPLSPSFSSENLAFSTARIYAEVTPHNAEVK